MTTFIFYARVGNNHCGLRLPAWGVAVMAGALTILASAIFFYSGSFAGSMVYQKESQRLMEHELNLFKNEVRLVKEANLANLDAATGKLGELYGRVITLDAKGKNLAEVAGLELPNPRKDELVADIPVVSGFGSTAAN